MSAARTDPGELMRRAIAYNLEQQREGAFTHEMVVELVRHWQATHGLSADGRCGPATQASLLTTMTESPDDSDEPFAGPLGESSLVHLDYVPSNRAEVYRVFGNPGAGSVVDPQWERDNIVTVRDLPGVPTRLYFKCHRLVEPYMREGLRRAQKAVPGYYIQRAGCFVFRRQRHDPKRPLSYHAWAIAVDIDSDDNFAKTFAEGLTPTPFSEAWRKVWPDGLPEAFVVAMESVGFTWGGRWRGFVDPMHFEFVRP